MFIFYHISWRMSRGFFERFSQGSGCHHHLCAKLDFSSPLEHLYYTRDLGVCQGFFKTFLSFFTLLSPFLSLGTFLLYHNFRKKQVGKLYKVLLDFLGNLRAGPLPRSINFRGAKGFYTSGDFAFYIFNINFTKKTVFG